VSSVLLSGGTRLLAATMEAPPHASMTDVSRSGAPIAMRPGACGAAAVGCGRSDRASPAATMGTWGAGGGPALATASSASLCRPTRLSMCARAMRCACACALVCAAQAALAFACAAANASAAAVLLGGSAGCTTAVHVATRIAGVRGVVVSRAVHPPLTAWYRAEPAALDAAKLSAAATQGSTVRSTACRDLCGGDSPNRSAGMFRSVPATALAGLPGAAAWSCELGCMALGGVHAGADRGTPSARR
jgi:hypothetical protein